MVAHRAEQESVNAAVASAADDEESAVPGDVDEYRAGTSLDSRGVDLYLGRDESSDPGCLFEPVCRELTA
jgi:hypothetical protein